MELFYAPMACSLVPRIVALELDLPIVCRQVEGFAKRLTEDGTPYEHVAPLTMVPVLRFDDGETLTEVQAIVQLFVDLAPEGASSLLGGPGRDRYRVLSWMSYAACELHKRSLWPRGNRNTPREVRRHAKQLAPDTFDHLEARLDGRTFIATDTFSAADAYLAWALSVAPLLGMELGERPRLRAYRARVTERASVAHLLAEERGQLGAALTRQAGYL
ncbi:MAG: glutathione S-transferase C-terminal domain-containing protein [Sandaracinaceae bacterium]